MQRTCGRLLAAALGCLVLPTAVNAGIIVDQPPFVGAGGPASDTAFINDYGEDSWEISADEFIAPRTAVVSRIVWWGFYGGNNPAGSFHPPTGDETMRIRFYEPRQGDGLPGTISYEATILNPSRTPTGASYGPHPAYRFEADLTTPFSLAESMQYWVEVTQIHDPKSVFRRFQSPDTETPYAFLNNWGIDWYLDSGGLSFQLWDVPEPSTLWFLTIPFIASLWKGVRARKHAHGRLLQAGILAGLIFPTAVNAGIIVDQPPGTNSGPAADTFWLDEFGDPHWQQIADDVLFSSTTRVDRVVWWGFYGGTFGGSVDPPSGVETMRIRFYDARTGDGLPGAIVAEQSFDNASRTATGRNVSAGGWPHPEFRFETDLASSVALSGGTRYWLEIVQTESPDSLFRWEYSVVPGGPFSYMHQSSEGWRSTNLQSNLAFQLITIPEPSAVLMLLAGATLLRRLTRRWRRGNRAELGKQSPTSGLQF